MARCFHNFDIVLSSRANNSAIPWKHIRTTNPIERAFATVRNRTRKTKGCLNRKAALYMVFKLVISAKKKWWKLSGTNRLPEVIQGVDFKDAIKQIQSAA